MKIWKKVLILIVFIVLIIAIVFGICFNNLKQKASIIREIAQKQETTLKQDNYYQKIINNSGNAKTIIEHYQKGKKFITFTNVEIKDSKETAKRIMFSDNGEIKIYNEKDKKEILDKVTGIAFTMIPVNLNFANSSDKEIIDSMKELDMSIKDGTYNGKDCYIYTAHQTPETYFDKETGVVLKYWDSEFTSEFEFEFGSVDESVFGPDLSGFVLEY